MSEKLLKEDDVEERSLLYVEKGTAHLQKPCQGRQEHNKESQSPLRIKSDKGSQREHEGLLKLHQLPKEEQGKCASTAELSESSDERAGIEGRAN